MVCLTSRHIKRMFLPSEQWLSKGSSRTHTNFSHRSGNCKVPFIFRGLLLSHKYDKKQGSEKCGPLLFQWEECTALTSSFVEQCDTISEIISYISCVCLHPVKGDHHTISLRSNEFFCQTLPFSQHLYALTIHQGHRVDGPFWFLWWRNGCNKGKIRKEGIIR